MMTAEESLYHHLPVYRSFWRLNSPLEILLAAIHRKLEAEYWSKLVAVAHSICIGRVRKILSAGFSCIAEKDGIMFFKEQKRFSTYVS